MPEAHYDVFISYRWIEPDQTWVRNALYKALQAAGLCPLLDIVDFVPGRDLILEMERAGMSSNHILCVISPEYCEGERMVDFEMLMARRRDPGGRHSRLIPLILRQTVLPESIRGLVAVEWINNENLKREWQRLLRALNAPNRQAEPPRLCEYVSPAPHDHKHDSSISLEVLEKAKAKFKQSALGAYRHPTMAEASRKPGFFSAYSELFFKLLPKSEKLKSSSELFDDIYRHIESSISPCPLLIRGPLGTGKSTFLFVLYLFLEARHAADPSSRWPIYIDLHHYNDLASSFGPERHSEVKSRLAEDFRLVYEVAQHNREQAIAIIVDGVDDFFRSPFSIDQELEALIQGARIDKKVVGLGQLRRDQLSQRERKRDISHIVGQPEWTIKLESINTHDERFGELVDAFCKCQELELGVSDRVGAAEMKARIRQCGLQEVDLTTLNLVYSYRPASSTQGEPDSLASLVLHHCLEACRVDGKGADPASLLPLSRLAYQMVIKEETPEEPKELLSAARNLVYGHSIFRDYLLATFVIHNLKDIAAVTEWKSQLRVLSKVYPSDVNRFCKQIMNGDYPTQREVFDAITKCYNEADISAKICFNYLLGRVEDRALCDEARSFLLQQKGEPTARTGRGSAANLLLQRTIYISLAYLGDVEASGEYIRLLMKFHEWDNVNRGFHLEYYGDLKYDPQLRTLQNKDKVQQDFAYTFSNLVDRIEASLRSHRHHNLFDIDLYTLCSLAQQRHVAKTLSDEKRAKVTELAQRAITEGGIGEPALYDYLRMVIHNCELGPTISIGYFAERLFALKGMRRTGWVIRGVKDCESVAAHMYGAYLIGLLYLPDENTEYSKAKILEMLLVHDLGEAFTGDIPERDKTQDQREEEAQWIGYLAKLGTYEGVSELSRIKMLFDEFENESSLNAQIAKDIDRLDALFQLCLYHFREKQLNDRKVFGQFFQAQRRNIRTAHGKRICSAILGQFGLGDDGIPEGSDSSMK